MLTILVLFVGLTLATAVIAYWSDNLGKKLGKKRVSLWGLRPRTTATFLTIASSWLIMVFTLGVMLTIFPPLRQSLLRYDAVKADVNELTTSKTQLTGQVSGLNGQLTELREQTAGLETQVKEASGKLKDARGQLKQSREASAQARKNAAAARKDAADARKDAAAALARQKSAIESEKAASDNLKNVRAQLNTTKEQREVAKQQLKTANGELKQANVAVASANAKVGVANARVAAADAQVAQAEEQFKRAELKLKQVGEDLKRAQSGKRLALENERVAKDNAQVARDKASLAEAKAKMAEDRAVIADARADTSNASRKKADKDALTSYAESLRAEQKVIEAEKRVAQLQEQSERLSLANEALFTINSQISDEADLLKITNVRVPVGRTLAERLFERGTSFSEATQGLRALFGRAADKSVPGFLPGASLQLAPEKVLASKENESDPDVLRLVGDNEIYDSLVDTIVRSRDPLSVRLISKRNHLEGEKTLYARFIAVPVRPALPADDELARANFDGRTGDAQLFSALLKLVETGREVASQNGVTPPLSPEAPDFYAPGSNEQIFVALREISAINAPVRVRILTAKPIETTDQLSVRFEVEPLGTTTAKAPARKAPA